MQNLSFGPRVDSDLANLTKLVSHLDDIALPRDPKTDSINQLLQVRLGLASSLFTALRLRHSPTADHSLRVALICSQWAKLTEMNAEERDELEIAALLHDIGKIGVPDPVLKKPSALSPQQAVAMRQAIPFGLRILSDCCVSSRILKTIEHVHTWYDGNRGASTISGRDLPLGARMIAIANAFDAMTSDRDYRQAMPRERAVAELFEGSGTQFDPDLVAQFAMLQGSLGTSFLAETAREWLRSLTQGASNRFWQLQSGNCDHQEIQNLEQLFFTSFFRDSRDAVIFVDGHSNIMRWNKSAEELTGVSANQITDCSWHPKLVGLRDQQEAMVAEDACPISRAVRTHTRMTQLVKITTRQGTIIPVDVHAIPVADCDGQAVGSVIIFHDKSREQKWRAQIETLSDRVARDPLTGVANRAEFDRFHKQAVASHAARDTPCSLVICDIDRFKSVNDELGHQAGDAALVAFAQLLTRCCRKGDLVARYGGEEFVVVCNDCGSAEAAQLAEEMRITLESTKLPELNNRQVTASFGVTELQPGDDAETMLRRADRGLLQAKETGRNRVVELGMGMHATELTTPRSQKWWNAWRSARTRGKPLDAELATNVPMDVVVQKLHGFISDHDAQVLSTDPNRIEMEVRSGATSQNRRSSDRPITFHLELQFEANLETGGSNMTATRIKVRMTPLRVRDRRQDPQSVAEHLMNSLKSYLMAHGYEMAPR